MYKSFRLSNFRGFEDLTISNLSRTNIITGLNDSGKTSVLEALFLHAAGPLAGTAAVQALRAIRQDPLSFGQFSENAWRTIFHNLDMSQPIEFHSKSPKDEYRVQIKEDKTGKTSDILVDSISLQNSFHQSNSVQVSDRHFPGEERLFRQSINVLANVIPNLPQGVAVEFKIEPPITEKYINALYIKGQNSIDLAMEYSNYRSKPSNLDVLEAIRKIDGRIESLEVLVTGGRPQLHARVNSNLLPFALLGDGVNAMAQYLLAISSLKNGILLLDEIGAGIHFEALEPMWDSIRDASKLMNTQIFATTHSQECVAAALNSFKSDINDLSIHRLQRKSDSQRNIVASYYKKTLSAAVEMNSELR